MSMDSYQSPISIQHSNSLKIHQHIDVDGKNTGANYDKSKQIFEIIDEIILKVNHKKYRLEEYHFHVPSEHKIYQAFYDAEIHYVFAEIEDDEKNSKISKNRKCRNICNCKQTLDVNTLVIGRFIHHTDECKKIDKVQVKLPEAYYEYDGSLTTGLYSPVRWIMGKTPIYYNVKDIIPIAKSARPIQELDGRIILYDEKN
jgi:carbonic anhydrase